MLMWYKELWLIDHGAALYFHHSWDNWEEQAVRPFTQVKDHVLLPWASELESVNETFRSVLTPERVRSIVELIPDEWLTAASPPGSAAEKKQVYTQFLTTRVHHSEIFVKEAQHAGQSLI
jgi:hypothetical protein